MGGVTTWREIEIAENSEYFFHTMLSVGLSCDVLDILIEQLSNGALVSQSKAGIYIVHARPHYTITHICF